MTIKTFDKEKKNYSHQRILGISILISDREKLKDDGIDSIQHLTGNLTKSIEQLFYRDFADEWDLLVFSELSYFENQEFVELLSLLQKSEDKAICFLKGYASPDGSIVIDPSNVDNFKEEFRKRIIRSKHKRVIAVYANSREEMNRATKPVSGISLDAIISGDIEETEGFEVFGAYSKRDSESTIKDAIRYVCEEPNRVLAISSLDELASNPSELLSVIEKINVAESGISVTHLQWKFFRAIRQNGDVSQGHLIIGSQLDDLIRGVDIVVDFSQMFHWGAPENKNRKVPSSDYLRILEHMKNGLTQKEIAKDLGVSRITISRHVAQMKKEGYLPSKNC